MYRFILKNTFTKIYIYHFLINIFIKISSQSYALETVSLSKTTSSLSMEGVLFMFPLLFLGPFGIQEFYSAKKYRNFTGISQKLVHFHRKNTENMKNSHIPKRASWVYVWSFDIFLIGISFVIIGITKYVLVLNLELFVFWDNGGMYIYLTVVCRLLDQSCKWCDNKYRTRGWLYYQSCSKKLQDNICIGGVVSRCHLMMFL